MQSLARESLQSQASLLWVWMETRFIWNPVTWDWLHVKTIMNSGLTTTSHQWAQKLLESTLMAVRMALLQSLSKSLQQQKKITSTMGTSVHPSVIHVRCCSKRIDQGTGKLIVIKKLVQSRKCALVQHFVVMQPKKQTFFWSHFAGCIHLRSVCVHVPFHYFSKSQNLKQPKHCFCCCCFFFLREARWGASVVWGNLLHMPCYFSCLQSPANRLTGVHTTLQQVGRRHLFMPRRAAVVRNRMDLEEFTWFSIYITHQWTVGDS